MNDIIDCGDDDACMGFLEESVIKRWLGKIGYKGTVGYYRNIADRTMTIYANSLGNLIGKQRSNAKEFEKNAI